jgi:predicted hydrolase (HD superfamily)
MNFNKQATIDFVHKYVSDEYQRHHAEMVSVAMRAIAEKLGYTNVEGVKPEENPDLFELTGLVHDWDYDQWSTEHPGRYEQLIAEMNLAEPEASLVVEAIKGHADLDYPRTSKLAQALCACDEFSGLLYAYAKMVGKYADMKISSIAKKMDKELNFAAKINREDIKRGIAELDIPAEEFYTTICDAFAAKYD